MRNILSAGQITIATIAAGSIAGVIMATHAHAQAPSRTFIATTGSDANACSITAPCRTLGVAVGVVAEEGDVIILDTGGFGESVVITKSVSVLVNPGVSARLKSAIHTIGLTVNGANIAVTLDGLGVTGSGGTGIRFLQGRTLTLRNLDVNVTGDGISHSAPGGFLTMQNVTVRNSTNSFCVGVHLTAASADLARATIVDSQALNCKNGFFAGGGSFVTIERSTATGSGRNSSVCASNFVASNTAQGPSTLRLDAVVATGCAAGLRASRQDSSSATNIVVSNALIVNNADAAVLTNGAIGRTFGSNNVFGNGTNTLTGFTDIAAQ